MNTTTAYTAYNRYVTKIVKSRIKNHDTASDVVQSAWLSIHQATLSDDPAAAKRTIRRIALRAVIDHSRTTLGRSGNRSRVNSGIVTGDTAEFILDQSRTPYMDWLAAYPPHLRSLASHLASGGSVRALCAVRSQRQVYADLENLKEFCIRSRD